MLYPVDVNSALLSLSLALEQLTNVAQKGGPAIAKLGDDILGTYGNPTLRNKVDFSNPAGSYFIRGFTDTRGPHGKIGGSRICWLKVPAYDDSVLVNLNHEVPKGKLFQHDNSFLIEPGVLSYVAPYPLNPKNALPAGLFCWKDAWDGLKQTLGDPYKGLCIGLVPSDVDLYAWDNNLKSYVKNGKGKYVPASNRHPNDQAVRAWIYQDIVDRNQAFEYVMGMTEAEFRTKLGLSKKLDERTGVAFRDIRRAHAESERRKLDGAEIITNDEVEKAIKAFNGLRTQLPQLLRDIWQEIPDFTTSWVYQLRTKFVNATLPQQKGKLFIMTQDALGSHEAYKLDVRYLQSHYKNAVFQIASTFACMEGGVKRFNCPLNDMNISPVQGENAVLGAMVGAIVRRYFIQPKDRNLLQLVKDVFIGAKQSSSPKIKGIIRTQKYDELVDGIKSLGGSKLEEKNLQAVLNMGLSGMIGVGIHTGLPVTSGSWGEHDIQIPRSDGQFPERSVPAFDKRMHKIHRVHHIYTSAVDIEHVDTNENEELSQSNSAIPKIALRAAYEGTILGAHSILFSTIGKSYSTSSTLKEFLREDRDDVPRVFLTLVGTGAFGNKVEWVVDILEQLQALIYQSGLQICLVVYGGLKNELMTRLVELSKNINNASNVARVSEKAQKQQEPLWIWNQDNELNRMIKSDKFRFSQSSMVGYIMDQS